MRWTSRIAKRGEMGRRRKPKVLDLLVVSSALLKLATSSANYEGALGNVRGPNDGIRRVERGMLICLQEAGIGPEHTLPGRGSSARELNRF